MRAKKPELVKPSKPKLLLSGKSGVGKTIFALNFPSVYYIDTEGGATREQYRKKLIEANGVYMGKEEGSQDFRVVIEEIRELATRKHDYKTLVIDSFTKLYNIAAAIAEEDILAKTGKAAEFSKEKKEANRPTRQLARWLESLDMTVLLVCHMKEKWERKNGEIVNTGTTFDGFDKFEYDLDLWIEAMKEGTKRVFRVRKSRIETLQENDIYPLEYPKFAELYGKDAIEKASVPIEMATPEQVALLTNLVQAVNLEPEIMEKWYKAAEASTFADFKAEQIQKCIEFVQDKLNKLGLSAKPEVNGKAKPELVKAGK